MSDIVNNKLYSADEFISLIDKLYDDKRYELIDGTIYAMSSPSTIHQRVIMFILEMFTKYFTNNKCEVFVSPLDVFLYAEKRDKNSCVNVYQPDLFVVCDKTKIQANGIYGAPDLVVEVVSKSTAMHDYLIKLNNYLRNGVKEYWIVDCDKNQIVIYYDDFSVNTYKFSDIVDSYIFSGLSIDFSLFVNE